MTPINPNTATIAELESLSGMTPALAASIIAHRPYASEADLAAKVGFVPAGARALMAWPVPAVGIPPIVAPPVPPTPPTPPPTPPTISIGNASVTASATANTTITFVVTLSAKQAAPVTLHYSTLSGTASSANKDYIGIPNATLVIPAGVTEVSVPVTILPGNASNAPKTFLMQACVDIPIVTATGTILPPLSAPPVVIVGRTNKTITTSQTLPPGTYGQILIATPYTDTVTLQGVDALNISVQSVGTYNEVDTKTTGTGNYGTALWRFVNANIQYGETDGTWGYLFKDLINNAQTAKSAKILNCRGSNIYDANGYASFIQFQHVRVPGLEIGFCAVTNDPKKTKMADGISFMDSGGTAAARALIRNCLVDGSFLPSGSGILGFDPGELENVTAACYTDILNNVVLATVNQHFCMAGGHDITFQGNRAVNDGTTVDPKNCGFEAENWGSVAPSTPKELWGVNTKFVGNFSYIKGRPNFILPTPVVGTGNIPSAGTTEAGERTLYAARAYKIGPRVNV